MSEPRPIQRIDEWVRAEIDGQAAVALPDLARRGVEKFLTEPDYLRTLFTDQLYQLIYDRANQLFRSSRTGPVVLGDEVVDGAEFARRAARLSVKWENWLEHAGAAHVPLLKMTRVLLLAAAAERDNRADAESRRAAFLRGLAKGLKGEQTVGQVFSAPQIEHAWIAAHRKAEAA